MKSFLFVLLALVTACQSSPKSDEKSVFTKKTSKVRRRCEKPYVFFDLGETIVDTATHNYKKIFYLPGVESYLKTLAEQNFRLGMIVNVPESWGSTHGEKLSKLKSFIKTPWDPSGEDFNWGFFDEDLVLLPPKDIDRKPAVYLFQAALEKAKAHGCQAVFQGEELEEVKVAKENGFHSFHIKRVVNGSGDMAPVFMTPEELKNVNQFIAE